MLSEYPVAMTDLTVASEMQPIARALLGDDSPLRLEFWDGSALGAVDAKATASFRSVEALRHMVWAPGELGISRAFVTGEIQLSGDVYFALTYLMTAHNNILHMGMRTMPRVLNSIRRYGVFNHRPQVPPEEHVQSGRRHSKARDKAAISHHYDVGNDFYRLILGETMTYSCARFVEPGISLDQAQREKYDLVCRKLGLEPGMRLLDVGCGWGGMVLHAAQNYGVTAVGITLSEQQAIRARERVAEAGLDDNIEIRVQDYRDVKNEVFDRISSIGMFEHVGRDKMTEYFTDLFALLRPGGRLLNHAISKPSGSMMSKNGFISRYVFPDGELQDIANSTAAMQDAGFEVRDIESLREHYTETLRHWVANLDANWDKAVELVGENRARIWWIYMTSSSVAFESGRIAIHQTLGVKTHEDGTSDMPPTRAAYV